MKAYILKVSFEDITPIVWRRVILPADRLSNHHALKSISIWKNRVILFITMTLATIGGFLWNLKKS